MQDLDAQMRAKEAVIHQRAKKGFPGCCSTPDGQLASLLIYMIIASHG